MTPRWPSRLGLVLSAVAVFSLAVPTASEAQSCEVATRFLELEGRGDVAAANALLSVPDEVQPFLDRPGYVPTGRTDGVSSDEERLLRALGALVSFELVGCERGLFGTVATVRVSRPDFVRLFPNRPGGLAIVMPATTAERERSLAVIRERLGGVARVPIVVDDVKIPIVAVDNAVKVGLP